MSAIKIAVFGFRFRGAHVILKIRTLPNVDNALVKIDMLSGQPSQFGWVSAARQIRLSGFLARPTRDTRLI